MPKLTLGQLKAVVEDMATSPEDLVQLLEITIEELLERFPDKIEEHREQLDCLYEADRHYEVEQKDSSEETDPEMEEEVKRLLEE